ncbi:hypothetical protein [Anatilimnocola floriformis]|uniref:hypothetical protein n=1 Tax=Anatilimnocola floriformis TaxID=2948575 RepID=UPI0020C57BE1|nr:hypothetical protein [Anatilimnocola floriformis]
MTLASPPVEVQHKAKAALTELFQQVRIDETPVIVERIVADIDEIVRMVRLVDAAAPSVEKD